MFVSLTNSSCVSCSGRLVRKSCAKKSASGLFSALNICFRLTRNILRRWLKTVFTSLRNNGQSHPRSVRLLRVILITADLTFGGGLNTSSSTVNRYSVSYHACINTESIPYVLLPGSAAMRNATSRYIMPVQHGMRSLLSSILKNICDEMSYG